MDEDFPQELDKAFKTFQTSMNAVEKSIKPLLTTERSHLMRGVDALNAAQLDLVSIYAMNSFYWSYLVLQGIDPKTHPIKQELDRIKTYMDKVDEIKNRKNAPKLAKEVAQRFIRNAMFDESKDNSPKNKEEERSPNEQEETQEKKSLKRKKKRTHKNKKRPKTN